MRQISILGSDLYDWNLKGGYWKQNLVSVSRCEMRTMSIFHIFFTFPILKDLKRAFSRVVRIIVPLATVFSCTCNARKELHVCRRQPGIQVKFCQLDLAAFQHPRASLVFAIHPECTVQTDLWRHLGLTDLTCVTQCLSGCTVFFLWMEVSPCPSPSGMYP